MKEIPAESLKAETDQRGWQQARELRGKHPRWMIIWFSQESEFHAYGRLPRTHRDTALIAPTPDQMDVLIGQVEEAVRKSPKSEDDLE